MQPHVNPPPQDVDDWLVVDNAEEWTLVESHRPPDVPPPQRLNPAAVPVFASELHLARHVAARDAKRTKPAENRRFRVKSSHHSKGR
jgi:hypothetical protein